MFDPEKVKFLEKQLENSLIENKLLKKYMPSSERAALPILKSHNLNISGYYKYIKIRTKGISKIQKIYKLLQISNS